MLRRARTSLLISTLVLIPFASTSAQSRKGVEIAQANRALSSAYQSVKLGYYDPSFRGLNLDSLYEAARTELDRAQTTQQRYRAIARFLEAFDDSHTGFAAPSRIGLWNYHIGLRFYGDAPLITRVDPGSQADRVGARLGDEIVRFAGKPLTRANYSKVIADFLAADSIPTLDLTVRGADGSLSNLALTADTMELRRMKGSSFRQLYAQVKDSSEFATSHVQVSIADSVFVWRLPQFSSVDRGLDDVIKRARKHRVLIMDLRGNPGGSIETLTKLLEYFVDEELVVGDLHLRTEQRKFTAKPKRDRVSSRMFVLVDSETASSAEIFARIMQLRGQAAVMGDRTAGMVMASQYFPADEDMGAYVTVSDFVLHNGERLEKAGVTPDILAVESPQHIAAGGDPVLALALLRSGVRVTPATARQLLLRSN